MEKHSIHLSHEYNNQPKIIFNLFKNGTVFHLTGADEIHFDFHEQGLFRLSFKERGIIDGSFLQILPNEKIILNWNVTGFQKPNEADTKVCFTFWGVEKTILQIDHKDILMIEAVEAKQRAWSEILADLEKEFSISVE